jgi:PPK2 family polyphosphate:nucleotide phosphotransferase
MKIYRVRPGAKVKLSDYSADGETELAGDKERGMAQLETLKNDLRMLQRMLYAERRHRLLVVLQGMDGSGKDGTVRNVFSGIDPHGLRVVSFKAPTTEELDHDFLWRHAIALPRRGEIGIHNRSWYEEVLTVRVHPEILHAQKLPPDLLTPRIFDERLQDIAGFERYLARQGTVILKFFLHLSPDEQRRRLLARIDEPDKNWKFDMGDLTERLRVVLPRRLPTLWTNSYFVSTVGGAPLAVVKQYIENQKHV